MKRLILSVLSIVFVGGAIFALPQEAFAQKVQAVEGNTVEAVDYSDSSHWLALPKKASKNVDIFFVYPTSWRSLDGYPVADLDNEQMVFWSKYYLDTRASAFEPAGNVYAPYYRQLDASFMINNFDGEAKELIKIPQGDVIAAFDYYIKHYNQGRPFVLVGHSQGSIMLTSVITDYLKENPEVYKRMVAAYLIGIPLTKQYYSAYPHMKAAQRADDVGVIVSYNVEAPVVDGKSAFSNPDSVLINPLSWKTDEELVPAADNIGSIVISFDDNNRYTFKKVKKLADAQINHNRGTIICTTVDAEKFSSALASRSYLPLGVLHENDIPLYYYSLRQNVKDRVKAYFNSLK